MSKTVHYIPTGVANTASVRAAFERTGVTGQPTRKPEQVRTEDYVVLPGVGSFGPGMSFLREHDLVGPLRERIRNDHPTMAICLGMQLLGEGSEESPDEAGLGILPETVREFPEGVRRPQFGWNRVVPDGDATFFSEGYAYFANSYRLETIPEDWTGARAEYGGSFVAGLERGNVVACQFHPELSGTYGHDLLNDWLEQ